MLLKQPYIKDRSFWLYASLLIMTTLISYFRVVSSEFISWDDVDLVTNNPDVQNFSVSHFFTRHYTGNYMPLTMLLYGIDWAIFNSSSPAHHFIPLLLHMANGLLVFVLTLRLFKNNWGAL